MPRTRSPETPKRTPAETLEFYFQHPYLPALNFLLGTVKGDEEVKKAALISLCWQAMAESLLPEVAQEIRALKEAERFHASVQHLATALNASLVRLERLLVILVRECEGRKRPNAYCDSIQHYTKVRKDLRLLVQRLESFEPLLPETETDDPLTGLDQTRFEELAYHVRTLIQLHDNSYRLRIAKGKAEERLGFRPKKAQLEDLDWLLVEYELLPREYEAREALSAYLKEHGTNYYIPFQGPFRRVSTEGYRPEPHFELIFGPFIDYLCNPKPPFTLAVCQQCGSVFLRTAPDNSSIYCDRHCAKEAYRFKKASRKSGEDRST